MAKQTDIARAQTLLSEQGIRLADADTKYLADKNDNGLDDKLERAAGADERSKEILSHYYEAADHRTGFAHRLKNFFAGTSKAGRGAKAIKDFALLFFPWGRQAHNLTEFVTEQFINPEQQKKDEVTNMWFINRLKEKTTWRGFIAVATAAGIAISPDVATAIVAVGIALAGLVEVIAKEPQSADG